MKHLTLTILAIILNSHYSVAQTQINKTADDYYEIVVAGEQKDHINIVQVTDFHFGNQGKWAFDFKAVRRIKAFVKKYQPDLIIVTGDLFTGNKESKEYLVAFAVQFLDDLDTKVRLTIQSAIKRHRSVGTTIKDLI